MKKITITGKQVCRAIAEYLCETWNERNDPSSVVVSEQELNLMSETEEKVRFFRHPITCALVPVVVGTSCISLVG